MLFLLYFLTLLFINEFSLPKILDIGVADLWFQQDGAIERKVS